MDSLMDEIYRTLTPARTVLLHKQTEHGTEVLWINAYPNLLADGRGMVVQTFLPDPFGARPGVVLERWTGPGRTLTVMDQTVTYRVEHGWQIMPTSVYSADTWDVTASFDKPAEF
jgi:hypothetical protein